MVTTLFASPHTWDSDNKYTGTLEAVLSELASNLIQTDLAGSGRIQRTLHPARIIRALIDYKIDHPAAPGIEALVQQGIAVALDAYSGTSDAAERIMGLHATLAASAYAPILTAPLIQPSDRTTQTASNPSLSLQTAQRLAASDLSDVLFIALGHGGVAAGMDVYLRYCQIAESTNSQFYVARFSTQKKGDTVPHLNPAEIAYLQDIASGKRVIIFDEDRCSGHTLEAAQTYFGLLFPDQSVEAVANLDMCGALVDAGFAPEVYAILKKGQNSQYIKHEQVQELYNLHILNGIYDANETKKNSNSSMYAPLLSTHLKENQNPLSFSLLKKNTIPDDDLLFLKESLPKPHEYLTPNS